MSAGHVALRGEMGSVTAVGTKLSRLDLMQTAMGLLSRGVSFFEAAGDAKSLTALVSACRPIEQHAQKIASIRVQAGDALTAYARQVAALQQEVRQLQSQKASAETRRAVQAQLLSQVDSTSDTAASQSLRLNSQLAESSSTIQHIEQRLGELDAARLSADQRCVQTISHCTAMLRQLQPSTGASGSAFRSPWWALTPAAINSKWQSSSALNADLKELLKKDLSPEEVAKLWEALKLTEKDAQQIKDLPIETKYHLANLNGIPAWARDIATYDVVKYALDDPEAAYKMLGFEKGDLKLKDFTEQVKALDEARKQAEESAKFLPGKPKVQIIGFGNHDGALTSSISIGDLDKASNVGINVSGMNSNVGEIGDAVNGAQSLFNAAHNADSKDSYAIVTWIGYRSPGATEVLKMDRADAGAIELANFIDGIGASRAGNPTNEFTVLAHSYGSTTAVEALQLTTTKIDSLVTYGSAGVKSDTKISDLNVDNVYATSADGDGVAWMGIDWGGRVDPRTLDDVSEFSAEGGDGESAVTVHDMFTEDKPIGWMNWHGKNGYLSTNTSSVNDMGRVIANGNTK